LLSIFFFQAEDGIRDGHVTGVQTCALPIFLSQILRQESALSNVSTPIVSGKCAVQSNVIAFIRHLHDTRSQDLLATRRHWLVNAGLQKERRTEGLGGHLHLTEGGNEIEILTGAAGIMAGLFLFVS